MCVSIEFKLLPAMISVPLFWLYWTLVRVSFQNSRNYFESKSYPPVTVFVFVFVLKVFVVLIRRLFTKFKLNFPLYSL